MFNNNKNQQEENQEIAALRERIIDLEKQVEFSMLENSGRFKKIGGYLFSMEPRFLYDSERAPNYFSLEIKSRNKSESFYFDKKDIEELKKFFRDINVDRC